MWWRHPNEDSSHLTITTEVETSSSLKYELKLAVQQVLSVELNIEHTTRLQFAHSLSFTFMFNLSHSYLKWVGERNQPGTWLLPPSKFIANFWVRLSILLPQFSFKYFIHSWSLLSSPAIISPMHLIRLQILVHFSALFLQSLRFPHLRELQDFCHHSLCLPAV